MARLAALDEYDTEASPGRRRIASSAVEIEDDSALEGSWMRASAETSLPIEGDLAGPEAAEAAAEAVTLVVYGWTAAEPGTLWWAFPSVAAALAAARAMKNAVSWAVVRGSPRGAVLDMARARASGSVLIEQTA